MNLGPGISFSWTMDASRGTLSPEIISKNFEESDVTLRKVLVLINGQFKFKTIQYSRNGNLSTRGVFLASAKSRLFSINQTISCVHVVPFRNQSTYQNLNFKSVV
jgi:hypothetical protein